jgi:hypothetical protein
MQQISPMTVTKPQIAGRIRARGVDQRGEPDAVKIELPEDVSQALQERWGGVSRRTLEAIALEGYRSGALTESQVRRLLGFETRMDVHAFLKQAGVPLHYTRADFEEDLEAQLKLGLLPVQYGGVVIPTAVLIELRSRGTPAVVR